MTASGDGKILSSIPEVTDLWQERGNKEVWNLFRATNKRGSKTSGPDSATDSKWMFCKPYWEVATHKCINTPGDQKTVRAKLTDIGLCRALDPFSLKKYVEIKFELLADENQRFCLDQL